MRRMKWMAILALSSALLAERYIAIDNVCAWPNLKRLADGSIVAVVFNQPSHGKTEGDVEAWVSRDGGKLWQKAGTPAPHEPGTLRVNHAFGLAHDGSLIVLAAGAPVANRQGWLPVWVCRSRDGGRTWTRSESVKLPDSASYLMPYGDIVQLPGGRLAAAFYQHFSIHSLGVTPKSIMPKGGSAYILFSEDDGKTWGNGALIAKDNYNETTLLPVGERRLLAVARTYDPADMEMFVSEDQGRTWSKHGAVSLPRQHPASLLKLADGRLLMTYGIRERANRAVNVRVSSDEGRTWGPAWPVVTIDGAVDSGYPSTVQLEDGTLVTAWYASGIIQHRRYHMGVLRWQLDPK